ncbi:UNVERIFIED_CONTAM: hypothetical protein Sradi_0196000 [Sesamum radiatum]|uniref:Reverse transcriptase domain-containing protein n=1 Tax=Sesamum radiatum TaxID=300843 RepID=A0AAW2W291_SESRA
MSKAYDRVEWKFLKAVLVRIGIHERFVRLIMSLVTSVSYSLLLNGSQFGYFMPQRGIRQGDPLSPYLFLFVAEVFSCMLQEAQRRGDINGIAVSRGGPSVSYLLFADDTIIYGQASAATMTAIKQILTSYERVSGQAINFDKSSMVVGRNVGEQQRQHMADILGVTLVIKHDTYLGLPAIAGRYRGQLFQTIKDRVWGRIQGWNAKLLSQAGPGVLIKAVLQAIPTYAMSCFRLLDYLLREIKSMIADFWWHNRGDRRTHCVSWGKLCQSKENGGLGFREMLAFNRAMLAKQGWRLVTRPDTFLSRIMKAKYFPTSSFFRARMGSRPSLTWRSILGVRDLVARGAVGRLDQEQGCESGGISGCHDQMDSEFSLHLEFFQQTRELLLLLMEMRAAGERVWCGR